VDDCTRPAGSIDRDGGPAFPVFVAQMDKQRVRVVLDAQAVGGIRLLVKGSTSPAME
jgi:hypothetical protein